MSDAFSARLGAKLTGGQTPAVVGLDPRVEALPRDLAAAADPADRILAFYREVIPLLAAQVPVVKPNIAFFEAHGVAGYRAYTETCAMARDAGMLVIGDIKRGDIGSTAAAYAREHFRHADAVTLHPYLGRDSVEPFLDYCRDEGRGVFVLVRTSNPSATDFQALRGPQGTLSESVADAVDTWGAELLDETGYSAVGAVVGATYASELEALRCRMPRAWLLLPGVGAQGATVAELGAAFGPDGRGALVSQSRGILQCFEPAAPDWRDRITAAVASFTNELRVVTTNSSR